MIDENTIVGPINYEGLRKEAMEHIEELASDLWTDYNTHDPGVTIMEILCFALTELGLRANLPINDLIAELLNKKQAGFYASDQILTSKPLTVNDYRKLLIDIEGVKNAWLHEIEGHHKTMYWDSVNDKIVSWSYLESLYLVKCNKCSATCSPDVPDEDLKDLVEELNKEFANKEIFLTRVNFRRFFDDNAFLEMISLELDNKEPIHIELDGNELKIQGYNPKEHIQDDLFCKENTYSSYSPTTTKTISPEEESQLNSSIDSLKRDDLDLLAYDFGRLFREYDYLSELKLIFEKSHMVKDEKVANYLKIFKDLNGDLRFASYNENELVCRGFYRVNIEPEEDFPKDEHEKILAKAHCALHQNRNLCELFPIVNIVKDEYVCVCFDIELSPGADVEEAMSKVVHRLDKFISPDIHFYSLKQMKEKTYKEQDRNHRIEEIFNGPLLKNGFIDDRELTAAEPKQYLYASDLIQEMMDVDEVQAVNRLMLSSFHPDEQGHLIPVEENKIWTLRLDTTRSTKLLIHLTVDGKRYQSEFIAHKGRLPYSVSPQRLLQNVKILKARDLPLPFTLETETHPTGRTLDLDYYYSVRNHFPMNYALKDGELGKSASNERRAKVMQLRAFLLFFDQLLGNSFRQLSKLGHLLSFHPIEHTYFVQLTEDARALKPLLSVKPKEYLAKIQEYTESRFLFDRRRNRFLDHLLARFAEEFKDYYALAEHVYGAEAKQRLIENKQRILKNMVPWSSERACAENILHSDMTPKNVSGLEYRLRVFLGMALNKSINQSNITLCSDFNTDKPYGFSITNRKGPLLKPNFFVDEEQREKAIEQLFTVLMDCWSAIEQEGKIEKLEEIERLLDKAERLDASNREEVLEKIREFLLETGVIEFSDNDEKMIVAKTIQSEDQWEFELHFKDLEIVLSSLRPFKTEHEADLVLYRTVVFLLDFHFIDKMYVFEHILLLLDNSIPEQTLPICTDLQGEKITDFDPYSFRITLVLPGQTELLSNMRFRQYLEKSIRETTPSHIFPKICWVSNEQMKQFGEAYKKWRQEYLILSTFKILIECLKQELIDLYKKHLTGPLTNDNVKELRKKLAEELNDHNEKYLEKALTSEDVDTLCNKIVEELVVFKGEHPDPDTNFTAEDVDTLSGKLVLLFTELLNQRRANLIRILNELESIYKQAELGGVPYVGGEGAAVILDYTKLGTLQGD